MNRQSSMLFAVLALALVAGLFFSNGSVGTQSLISQSTVLDSNKPVFVTTLVVDAVDTTSLTISPPKGTLANGTTVTPDGSSLSLTFSPSGNKCSAQTQVYKQIPLVTYRTSAGVTETIPFTKLYQIGSPKTSVQYSILAKKSNGQPFTKLFPETLDAANPADWVSFMDGDGVGQVRIDGLGYLSGAFECSTLSDLAVIESDGDSRIGLVSYGELVARYFQLTGVCGSNFEQARHSFAGLDYTSQGAACADALHAWSTTVFSKPNAFSFEGVSNPYALPDLTKIYFDLTPSSARGVITVVSDASYFNSVIFTPATAADALPFLTVTPAFTNALTQDHVQYAVTYGNNGKTPVAIYVTSPEGATTGGEILSNGQTQSRPISVTACGSTGFQALTFKACAKGSNLDLLGTANCASQVVTLSCTARPTPPPVTPSPTVPPHGCSAGYHVVYNSPIDIVGSCVKDDAPGFDLWAQLGALFEKLRLSSLACSNSNGVFSFVCGLLFPVAVAVIAALVVSVLAIGVVFLPLVAVLAVLFYFAFNAVDLYWPLLLVGAFLYKHGKKQKWF